MCVGGGGGGGRGGASAAVHYKANVNKKSLYHGVTTPAEHKTALASLQKS